MSLLGWAVGTVTVLGPGVELFVAVRLVVLDPVRLTVLVLVEVVVNAELV